MKYVFLIFISIPALAIDSAHIQIEFKDSTRENQILVLEKNKDGIYCRVSHQPARKLTTPNIKSLKFPLPNMKSVNTCDKVITWNYKNKSQKSCYFTKQDRIIDDILFDCYN
jgi:hypothetical protein